MSFVQRMESEGKTRLVHNPRFTWKYFDAGRARTGQDFWLPRRKEAGTYRVFVMGGSAAMGDPRPAYGISRMLALMLHDRFEDAQIEVVNVATTAINSHVVLEIATACSRLEPDLFVIYMGNNEVVGPFGPGTVFSPMASSRTVIRMSGAATASRTGQLLKQVGQAASSKPKHIEAWDGMRMFLDKQVRDDDPRLETVYGNFEANLRDICKLGRKRSSPVIVSTVGVNLRDNPPFGSLLGVDLSDADRVLWDKHYKQGAALEEAGLWHSAIERYQAAAKIDDGYAVLEYRLGRCRWESGAHDAAGAHYERALEQDTLRFRADRQINAAIRRVGETLTESDVHLVDGQRVLAAASPAGTAGGEMFVDHVHLSFEGNYLLAKAIVERILELRPSRLLEHDTGRPVISMQQCTRYLAFNKAGQFDLMSEMQQRFAQAPFTNQLYHRQRMTKLDKALQALNFPGSGDQLRKMDVEYRAALKHDPKQWRLRKVYSDFLAKAMNDWPAAESQWRSIYDEFPHSSWAMSGLANTLRRQKKYAQAIRLYKLALKENPHSPEKQYEIAKVYDAQGNLPKAISMYEQVVQISPGFHPGHFALANACLRNGPDDLKTYSRVTAHYERVMPLVLGSREARQQLARVYFKQAKHLEKAGRLLEGEPLYVKALDLYPDFRAAHQNMAFIANKKGEFEKAIEHLQQVLRIKPDDQQARNVIALLRQKLQQ